MTPSSLSPFLLFSISTLLLSPFLLSFIFAFAFFLLSAASFFDVLVVGDGLADVLVFFAATVVLIAFAAEGELSL